MWVVALFFEIPQQGHRVALDPDGHSLPVTAQAIEGRRATGKKSHTHYSIPVSNSPNFYSDNLDIISRANELSENKYVRRWEKIR
jgi:hypothetical protein